MAVDHALMAALASPDWMIAAEAVERCGKQLRQRDLGKADSAAIGEEFRRLASQNPNWQVRCAVAVALKHLRNDDAYLPALATLLSDENLGVVRAAERSRALRDRAGGGDFLSDEHAGFLAESYAQFERDYGPKAAKAALRVAERYVEAHVRTAYHEILNAILSVGRNLLLLKSLRGKPIDAKAIRRYVTRASKSARLTLSMVKGLREFSIAVSPVFQNPVLRKIVKDAERQVRDRVKQKKGRRVRVAIDIDPELRLQADPLRLTMAFSNLIQNSYEAFHGVDRPHRLAIDACTEGEDWILVRIADNGSGIAADDLEVVSKLFKTTKKKQGGTGVGLTMAKKIVESEHRGLLTIQSIPGASTTVTVRLRREQGD